MQQITKTEINVGNEIILMLNVHMRDSQEENYEKMTRILEENKEKSIIIGGDSNARTASKGGKLEDQSGEERRLSDDKIINNE